MDTKAREEQERLIAEAVANGRVTRIPAGARSIQATEQVENDKRGLRAALGHDPDVGIDQWQKDRAVVLAATGHGPQGECNRVNAGFPAPALRHGAWAKYAGESDSPGFVDCTWWWCRRKLTPVQWANLCSAVNVLQGEGIDVAGSGVADVAYQYADQLHWRRHASTWHRVVEQTMAYCPEIRDHVRGTSSAGLFLLDEMAQEFFARPEWGKKDVPLFRLMLRVRRAREGVSSDTWWPTPRTTGPARVSAAILIVFGLVSMEELGNEDFLHALTRRLENCATKAAKWGTGPDPAV